MRKYEAEVHHLLTKAHPRGGIVDLPLVTTCDVSSALIRSIAVSEAEMSDPAVPIFIIAMPTQIYGMAECFKS